MTRNLNIGAVASSIFAGHGRLRLPVVAAPMFLISGPELVIEACRSGIIGAFPTTNARSTQELDAWMGRISTELRDGAVAPWATNVITHSTNQRLPQDLELVARYRPPLVITALGSPKPAIELVHSYGGIVIADVVNLTLAKKAIDAGADGLACVSAGAGGHTGFISPFAFISAARELTNGLVIVGGGIADGYGVAGAIAAGADLVYMGTRFIATRESRAVEDYKKMVVDSTLDDLLVSASITGTPATWLKPSLRRCGYDPEQMPDKPQRNYDSSQQQQVAKRWKDLWSAGQGIGAVRAIEPMSAVVDSLAREYEEALARMAALATRS
ncbi:MAG TPA: nitronate monooxygenase [Steroidobacteraceae bacterium]|nr:nitronate monooxygenase [Steroidobacteraceae bacterium]